MEGREGDPLLSRYTPSHYIPDKGLSFPYHRYISVIIFMKI